MAARKSAEHILGVTVAGRTLYAVLMQHGEEGPVIVRRFTRQQASAGVDTPGSMPDEFGDMEETGGDFNISFGGDDGGGMDDMFMASEFGGLDGGELGGAATAELASFALELGDILAECEDLGYTNLSVAFALGASDAAQAEVQVPDETVPPEKRAAGANSSEAAGVGRKKLIGLLEAQQDISLDKRPVGFLPLPLSGEGIPRYFAFYPKPNDPISSTLRELRKEKHRLPSIKLMDAEVPLFVGVVRSAVATESLSASGHTLVVRAGAEDTLVLFMEGTRLHHSENLRSLTASEAPETICSRVLLLQDEYGVGEIDQVLVLSDEREREVIESFEMFFPEAAVQSMRRVMPTSEKAEESHSAASMVAVAAAMRLSKEKALSQAFEDINLLSKELTRRQFHLPVSWHVMALCVLLFCSVLFFIGRYFSLQGEISEYRQQLDQEDASLVEADPQALQARIDSLQQIHEQYVDGLEVLEDLLIGSDKWTRSMEEAAREMAAVEGVWVASWQPSGSEVQVEGHSTSRDRVVALAERLEGRIETLSFDEIREWPVYAFQMYIPVEEELPEAANYLREQVADQREEDDLDGLELPAETTSTSD